MKGARATDGRGLLNNKKQQKKSLHKATANTILH